MILKRKDAHAVLIKMQENVKRALTSRTNVNSLIVSYLRDIGCSTEEFRDDIISMNSRFEHSLLSTFKGEADFIPQNTHRMWVTDALDPQYPPEDYINKIAEDLIKSNYDCENFFWSNSIEVLDQMNSRLENVNVRKTFNLISTLVHDELFTSVIKLIDDKKFVFASDFLRVIILRRYGGIYSDLGVSYSRSTAQLAFLSEYLVLLGEDYFFQTSLLGAAPNSAFINLFHGVLCNTNVIPHSWMGEADNVTAVVEVNTLAGPGFTALLHMFVQPKWRIMVVRNDQDHVSWTSRGSWYGEQGQFGNILIQESDPSLINLTETRKHAVDVSRSITGVNCPKIMYWRLFVLIGLAEYFSRNPTPLCEIMYFNQSDKALAWHNYTYIYYYILKLYLRMDNLDGLLEVGIGTNFLDVPSSMGATGVPGASLRGWKEFLGMPVIGADIDTRILFKDEGIDTFYVDQLQPDVIRALWRQFERKPSIVIDDGLHTFDANVNFWRGAVEGNIGMQLFVVEDVFSVLIDDWKKFLFENSLSGLIIQIPNVENHSDNNLVFVFSVKGYT